MALDDIDDELGVLPVLVLRRPNLERAASNVTQVHVARTPIARLGAT